MLMIRDREKFKEEASIKVFKLICAKVQQVEPFVEFLARSNILKRRLKCKTWKMEVKIEIRASTEK